jgi:extradiol dioxygenase family protein
MNIKNKGFLLSVKDIEKSKKFYTALFDEKIKIDLEDYVVFESGLYLHAKFHKLISKQKVEIKYHGIDKELYYEVDDFDAFINKLNEVNNLVYLNKPYITPWNQKVVRIFDPDFHIIEIAESMESVIYHLLNEGKSKEEISKLTSLPINIVEEYLEKLK